MPRAPFAAIALVLALAPPARAEVPAPVVYAHRGGAGIAPENTLGAFRQAQALFGARGVWIEMDVQLAADDRLVVIHDGILDRTTSCSGTVVSKTAAELWACDARKMFPSWPDYEGVPSFAAVLAEGKANGWRIIPELKNIPGEPNFDPSGTRAAAALVAEVAAADYPLADIVVQSFVPTSLDNVKLREPRLAVALLTTARLGPEPAGFPAASNGAYATARAYEVSAPDHRSVDLNADTVAAIKAAGRRVVVWTVNSEADIRRVRDAGVDGLMSDRPDRAYEVLDA